jgi:HK97 family phage major capsid protein
MNAIEAGAVADQRDTLTDMEQTTWDELRAEAEAKTGRLELLVERAELDAHAGQLMGRTSRSDRPEPGEALAAATSPFPYHTPGEYVQGYMRSKRGDAAEAARFQRALADVTTAQTPGLVPPQVTGDVLGQWMARRPSVDAMSHPTLPPVGMEVQRPHITQHTEVAEHTEKQPIASQAFELDLLKIPLSSWAGGVDVSWELANRSSPGALDIIFQDLVAVYARRSNTNAWASVAAQVTQSVAWDGTAGGFASALAQAAIEVAQNSTDNQFPNTVWMGLTTYGMLASLVDGNGRPLFPFLGPTNAYGTADLSGAISTLGGLRAVVDPNIPPDTFVVGDADAVEFYETPGAPVQLSVIDVGVAGYNIGVIGLWAAAATDPKSFVTITYTAPAPGNGNGASGTSASSGGGGAAGRSAK